ncbi:hypothetical protein F4778DRAFT_744722 [Xylariomycetidae sp. FL2044]|nr:hypothetical protein F4778DRAFT_744722 [Xylariomycetidae sp. FL2044]
MDQLNPIDVLGVLILVLVILEGAFQKNTYIRGGHLPSRTEAVGARSPFHSTRLDRYFQLPGLPTQLLHSIHTYARLGSVSEAPILWSKFYNIISLWILHW